VAPVVVLLLMPLAPVFLGYVLSFLTGAVVAGSSRPGRTAAAMGLACLAASFALRPGFAFPLAGLVALLLARAVPGESPRALASASQATYEFFLVHGPVYLGLARVAGLPWTANLVVGTAVSVLGAWLLRRAAALVRSLPMRLRARALRPRTVTVGGR
jgi:hypothetical protein